MSSKIIPTFPVLVLLVMILQTTGEKLKKNNEDIVFENQDKIKRKEDTNIKTNNENFTQTLENSLNNQNRTLSKDLKIKSKETNLSKIAENNTQNFTVKDKSDKKEYTDLKNKTFSQDIRLKSKELNLNSTILQDSQNVRENVLNENQPLSIKNDYRIKQQNQNKNKTLENDKYKSSHSKNTFLKDTTESNNQKTERQTDQNSKITSQDKNLNDRKNISQNKFDSEKLAEDVDSDLSQKEETNKNFELGNGTRQQKVSRNNTQKTDIETGRENIYLSKEEIENIDSNGTKGQKFTENNLRIISQDKNLKSKRKNISHNIKLNFEKVAKDVDSHFSQKVENNNFETRNGNKHQKVNRNNTQMRNVGPRRENILKEAIENGRINDTIGQNLSEIKLNQITNKNITDDEEGNIEQNKGNEKLEQNITMNIENADFPESKNQIINDTRNEEQLKGIQQRNFDNKTENVSLNPLKKYIKQINHTNNDTSQVSKNLSDKNLQVSVNNRNITEEEEDDTEQNQDSDKVVQQNVTQNIEQNASILSENQSEITENQKELKGVEQEKNVGNKTEKNATKFLLESSKKEAGINIEHNASILSKNNKNLSTINDNQQTELKVIKQGRNLDNKIENISTNLLKTPIKNATSFIDPVIKTPNEHLTILTKKTETSPVSGNKKIDHIMKNTINNTKQKINKTEIKNYEFNQVNFTEIEEKNSTFEYFKNETDYIKADTKINLTEINQNDDKIDDEITEKKTNITQIIETVEINKNNNTKQTKTEKKETRTVNKIETKLKMEMDKPRIKNFIFAKIINKTNETHHQENTTYGKILIKALNNTKFNHTHKTNVYGIVHKEGTHASKPKTEQTKIFETIQKDNNTRTHKNVYGKIVKDAENTTKANITLYGTIHDIKNNTTNNKTEKLDDKKATFGKIVCQKLEKSKKPTYGQQENRTPDKIQKMNGNSNKIIDKESKGHEIVLMFSSRPRNNTNISKTVEENKNTTLQQSNETIDLKKVNKNTTHLKNISILRPKPITLEVTPKKYQAKPKTYDRCTCFWPGIEIQKSKAPKTKNKGIFRVLNLHIHHQIEEETFEKKPKRVSSIQNDQPHSKSLNVENRNSLERVGNKYFHGKAPLIQLETLDKLPKSPVIHLEIQTNNTYLVPLATEMKSKRSKNFTNTTIIHDFHSKKTEDQFPETIERRNASYRRKLDSSSRLIENLPNIRLPGDGEYEKRTVVSLLGLFELSTKDGERPEGRSELAAAHLAVKHINTKKLLPGYTLELLTNDTQCDPGVGVDRFFHALYTQKSTRMVMLLGSACSEVTESLAKVVPYWNIVQVSFGSTSPALSDRQEFPLFYRTVAPDSSHNPARIAFVRRFGWDTVAAISQNGDAYSLALNELVTELENANITCTATITFAETDLKDQLRILRDLDTRIIIGSFSHEVAPKIFCEAYQLGMFGADYAWILQGNGANAWWTNSTECPRHQLIAAVEGLIMVSSHNSIVGKKTSLSGLTNEMFASELEMQAVQVSKYAPQTYDAVWAIALALSGAENIWKRETNTTVGHFDYTRRDMASEFLSQLGRLNFLGISGPVSFSGADRVGTSAFHQVQDEVVHTVALYYPSSLHLDFTCPGCRPLRWQGGQVPIARRVFKLRVVTIAPAAFLAMSSLAVVGITLALAFLAFNLHFRRLKSIKLSSPRLNNMTMVGCILVYAAVILLGLDHATLRVAEHFATVCTARVYLLSAGFSLAFGSMFTKTYRVHRIFIRSRSGVVKDKLLQDTQLISLIFVLLLIDVLIVTLWVIIDPMQRHLRNLTLEISATDRSVVYQPQVEVCRSQNTNGWLGALYVYKGLLLLVGVYMAWETRHVKIPALNDSQYIGMSVYSVVITSGIVVVLANLMSDKATLAFVTITTFILVSTTTTLCLVFLPIMHAILKRADNCDPVIQSMDLKLECNTRRFVTDDRRELQYRVEIQNKVYRREVAALDLEIGRLEKQLLDMNSVSGSSSTSSLAAAARKLVEQAVDDNIRSESHPRTPSIGGGLPLLLLSVLPPVIPRASWPSAVQDIPMRRNVTFSSEPKLDDRKQKREPMIDLYNLCLRPERFNEKLTVLGRLKSLFGSRPSIRKSSASSYAGNSSVGIASALRVHMGYIAGLVPGSNKQNMASSCNTSSTGINRLDGLYSRRQSFARQGGSGPIISITSDADDEDDNELRRKLSLAYKDHESKVNFALPLQKRKSITHQHSQPVLSFRERAKGSPRFPHKIMPTCSLTALEDRRKSSVISNPSRRSSHQPPFNISKKRKSVSHVGNKWRSMEDASTTILPGSRRGSGVLALSCLPSSANPTGFKPRAASYSPNCDVWSTAEFGIPLSELGSKECTVNK